MAIIDFAQRDLLLNIVYFGPRQAGCGTNVRQLHRLQPAREKAELVRVGGAASEDEGKDRIWHFSYHPADAPRAGGFGVRMRVASVPGGVDVQIPRDDILDGLDGVVFVADARAHRADENRSALHDLERCLAGQGLDLGAIPIVVQVNHADAPNARPTVRVLEELGLSDATSFEGIARQGKAVVETHEAIRDATLSRLHDQLGDHAVAFPVTALSRAARDRVHDLIFKHAHAQPQAGRPLPRRLTPLAPEEVTLRVPQLLGETPLHVLRAEVHGGHFRFDIVTRGADHAVRKLAVHLEPGHETGSSPAAVEEITQPMPAVPSGPPSVPAPPPPPAENDLSPMAYGVIGTVAGFISGFLTYYVSYG